MVPDVSGVASVDFFEFLFTGEFDLIGIDDNDEIAGITMGSEDGFVLAAEKAGGFDGHLTKDFIGSIDDPPFAVDFFGFCGKRFHEGEIA